MIDSILSEAATSSFDFRKFANPSEPLSARFESWVPYYRLKFAIAKVLQPQSILEVGVRFGYSARTFLEASPDARLIGIDLDSDRFGGEIGALSWARKITAEYDAHYLVADTQKMKRFPGDIYDFIHVDGQQDGTGTFHDLRRAVSQARWVLLDGYFWTRPNFLNANDFLLKFKDVISYSVVIPGHAGELLIRVSDRYLASIEGTSSAGASNSTDIVRFYDSPYYLSDCGGAAAFSYSGGRHIADSRLLSVLALSELAPKGPAVDLGCGRGEITYQLALGGREVVAVDYSATAIEIARQCFRGHSDDLKERVRFVCGDATSAALPGHLKLATAADLIEHLSEEEVGRLMESIADKLDDDGVFVVHTFPNRWYYRRHYGRLRTKAAQLGAFLPAEPRSRYELLMHINEQSPARLRRALKKQFSHVAVWVGAATAPGDTLLRPCRLGELSAGPDVYAVASQSPLDLGRVKRLLTQDKLSPGSHNQIQLSVEELPATVTAGRVFELSVNLPNNSEQTISSMVPYPINMSYHWMRPGSVEPVVFDGLRTNLPRL